MIQENMRNLSLNQVINKQISASQAPTMLPDEEEISNDYVEYAKVSPSSNLNGHLPLLTLTQDDMEKDAEALDSIMESALLAKAGAISSDQKLGATPHKQRVPSPHICREDSLP